MAAKWTEEQLRQYVDTLDSESQLTFVLLASKYHYLVTKKKGGKQLEEGLTLDELDIRMEKYLGESMTRPTNQKILTIGEAMKDIERVWKNEPTNRSILLDKRCAMLSKYTDSLSFKDIQTAIGAPVASTKRNRTASANNEWWKNLAEYVPPAPPVQSKPTRPIVRPPPLPTIVPAAPLQTKAAPSPPPPSRNLFPDLKDLSTLHTLDALNRLIEEKYRGRLGNEDARTIPTGQTIRRYMAAYKDYTFTDFRCMHSEGSNADCLIHSFLTATCPAFRRLTSGHVGGGRDKNEFATWFRHYVYPTTPAVQHLLQSKQPDGVFGKTTGDITRERIFTPGTFLSDTDIGLLCTAYNQNILSFEGQQGEAAVRITTTNKPGFVGGPYCMISNQSGVHFESVQTPEGSYTIPSERAIQIALVVNERNVREAVEGMTEAASVRIGIASIVGLRLREGGSASNVKADLRRQIDAAKQALRRPVLLEAAPATADANVTTNTRNTYIRKMMTSNTAHSFRAVGLNDATLREQFGEAWNTAKRTGGPARGSAVLKGGASGGNRTHKRSLRPRRRHTSKGHGRRSRTYKH